MKIFIIFSIFVAISLLSLLNAENSEAQSFAEKTTAIETLTVGGTTVKYHKFGGKYNNAYLMVYDTADASSRIDSIIVAPFYPLFNSFATANMTDLFGNVIVFASNRNGRATAYRINHTVGIDSIRVTYFNAAPTGRKVYYYFRLFNTY